MLEGFLTLESKWRFCFTIRLTCTYKDSGEYAKMTTLRRLLRGEVAVQSVAIYLF